MDKQKAIDYIVENADKDWIYNFLYDVVEIDWVVLLRDFSDETLEEWARELGYSNPREDY